MWMEKMSALVDASNAKLSQVRDGGLHIFGIGHNLATLIIKFPIIYLIEMFLNALFSFDGAISYFPIHWLLLLLYLLLIYVRLLESFVLWFFHKLYTFLFFFLFSHRLLLWYYLFYIYEYDLVHNYTILLRY